MANAEVTIYDASTGKVTGSKVSFVTPSEIKTSPNEILQLRLNQNQINGSEQIGNDLVIYVEGAGLENRIIVKDYFNNKVKLVIEDTETGNLSLANAPEGAFTGLAFTSIDSIDQVVSGAESENDMPGWVLPVLGVAAAVGIGAAIADNNSGSSHHDSGSKPTDPIDPIDPIDPTNPTDQPSLWEVLKEFVEGQIAHWKDIINQIKELPSFKAIGDIFDLIGKAVKGGFDTIVGGIKTFFKGGFELLEGIGQKISLTVKFGTSMLAQGFDFIVDVIKFPALLISNPLQALKELLDFDHIGTFISTVKNYATDMWGAFTGTISNVFNTWKTYFGETKAFLSDAFNDLMNISFIDLLRFPLDLFSAGKSVAGGFISGFVDFVKFIPESIEALLKGGLGLGDFIKDATDFIGNLFSSDGIIGSFVGTIKDALFGEGSFIGSVVSSIKDVIGGIFGEDSIIGSIVNSIKDTVGGIFGEGSIIGNIVNSIKDTVGGIFGEGSIIGNIVNSIKDIVGGIFGEGSLIGNIGNTKAISSVDDLVADNTDINLDALLPTAETTGAVLSTETPIAVNSTPELLMAMNDQQYHVA